MPSQELFKDENTLFDDSYEGRLAEKGPVTCLGMTFENDEERRQHFTQKLREKLKDPEFRKIEGFPLGDDEDILNLSDPPYYTACPNPWIADFVKEWEEQKPEKPKGYHYHREPFAADVSEGKTDPIYQAHAYHTKVPHKAIMRYLLHYTEPGDVILDGFCGTGMAGVAAQLCGNRKVVSELGYKISPDGEIFSAEIDIAGKAEAVSFSKLGIRKSILNDLSTIATFIASNYTIPFNEKAFKKASTDLLKKLKHKIGWMYETLHSDGKTIGSINYTVWSEVFACHQCGGEIVFVEEAFDEEKNKVKGTFPCPSCGAECSKNDLQLLYESVFDDVVNDTIQVPKRIPVLINYSVGKNKYTKKPDSNDLEVILKISNLPRPATVPTLPLPPMQMAKVGRMQPAKITHAHHFFLKRALCALGEMWSLASEEKDQRMRSLLFFFVEQAIWTSSVLNRFRPSGYSQVNQYLAGVFYVPSQHAEPSPWYILEGKAKRIPKAFSEFSQSYSSLVNTGDCGTLPIKENSIDYIFTDPPFGENIYYSDLNFLIESWHKVETNPKKEAIVDKVKNKALPDYQVLMEACFREYYRILKPGRWITIEFSNTKASVWNSIQTALSNAGFIVASVSALDKKQGTFQAVNTSTAVKQDLVISAYKPNGGFEERFLKEAETEEGVWDFVRTHLKYLPVIKRQGVVLQPVTERDPRILFDQMVAYYVRKGYPVPISTQEFQQGLAQRFSERDGMYFLPEQAAEYDRHKMASGGVNQTIEMFIKDEESMIHWLRQLLKQKPQTFSDLNPQFMQQLGGWSKNEEQLDLRELLNQNFLCYEGKGTVPEQIHTYLSSNWKDLRNLEKEDPALVAKAKDRWYVPDPSKAGDLEKLRERSLLKEFETYKTTKQKLKVFRLEAVRAGFKKCWQDRDYKTIVAVAERVPHNVLEEDPKLLMWYDQAITRMGND